MEKMIPIFKKLLYVLGGAFVMVVGLTILRTPTLPGYEYGWLLIAAGVGIIAGC